MTTRITIKCPRCHAAFYYATRVKFVAHKSAFPMNYPDQMGTRFDCPNCGLENVYEQVRAATRST